LFLDYFALFLLFFVALTLFYGIIVIHDIPYEIAKKRNHPQQDALHVAGWISLFTLHTIWPFLWIWATLYREDRGWGFGTPPKALAEGAEQRLPSVDDEALVALKNEIASLNQRLQTLEAAGTLNEAG
jgi:hypothetical protein